MSKPMSKKNRKNGKNGKVVIEPPTSELSGQIVAALDSFATGLERAIPDESEREQALASVREMRFVLSRIGEPLDVPTEVASAWNLLHAVSTEADEDIDERVTEALNVLTGLLERSKAYERDERATNLDAPQLPGMKLNMNLNLLPEPPTLTLSPSTLAKETERTRVRLRDLRTLLYALELHIDDPAPPGPLAAQAVAHAAADLVGYVARLDLLRRNATR